jgi:hypothetical protein
MDFTKIAEAVENLDAEEEENLSIFKDEHPEFFPDSERLKFASLSSSERLINGKFRTTAQKLKAARKQQRRRAKRKLQQEADFQMLGIEREDYDRRIRKIKVYKIQTKTR